jgi:hypothetical protein
LTWNASVINGEVAHVADEQQLYAAVVCRGDSVPGQQPCGRVKINEAEYSRQMDRPDSLWMCPHCDSSADFDDEFFEELHGIADEENPDDLYEAVRGLARNHTTDVIRGICDALDAEAAEHG